MKKVAGEVDLQGEESFSSFAGNMIRQTWGNSLYIEVYDLSRGHFRGPRGYSLKVAAWPLLKDAVHTLVSDGVGTKVIPVTVAHRFDTVARDILAMTGGDITRYGGVRLAFTSVLDVASLGRWNDQVNRAYQSLVRGLQDAAREQELVVLNGETAELGNCVGSEDPSIPVKFNWGGTMAGAYHPERMILGETLQAGQVVVALKERGFRSNGFRTVRAALCKQYGDRWWESPIAGAQGYIDDCAAPSVIYDRFLEEANGWQHPKKRIPMHGIAHISGGGIPTKFGDLLRPHGLSARLDNLFSPPLIMQKCRTWAGLSHEEAYRQWNGGQGVLVVLDEGDVPAFLKLATAHGIAADVAGRITDGGSAPAIALVSKYEGGDEIRFLL